MDSIDLALCMAQNNIAACRMACEPEFELPFWDKLQSARAELTTLRAEVGKLKAEQVEMGVNLHEIQNIHDAQKARLYSENAALKADAERYRWLRDNREQTFTIIFNDAAIDAAMKEQK